MRVCRADKGNTAAFTCSYHAWTYDTTGALIGVPKLQYCYYGELDKRDWGLLPVAQVDTYKGLIFGTFNEDAPTLRAYLGDMAWYLDTFLDRREGGTELVPGTHRWIVKTNWKVGADNNVGDNYHVAYAHASFTRLLQRLRRNSDGEAGAEPTVYEIIPHPGDGHGLIILADGSSPRGFDPVAAEYYRDTESEASNRLGEVRSRRIGNTVGLVYPNFGWIGPSILHVYQPRGPQLTEIQSYCLVDRDASSDVKHAARLTYLRTFGPSGLLEQDDGENWSQVSASSSTPLARDLEFNYQMGLGHEYQDAELPGTISRGPTELPHRNFYSRWARDMGFATEGGSANGRNGKLEATV
jgi:3-phenylpropionate/trans-cinnamate dioxygenase alpha subunit